MYHEPYSVDHLIKVFDSHIDYYISLGFALIPAFPSSKRPCMPWKIYQIKPPSKSEIEEWRRRFWHRGYNVGVLGGSPSGNLAVIDIDSETLSKTFNVELLKKETMVVMTGGGGYHIYLRTPKPVRTVKFLDENKRVAVELRAEGSFNILPPSIHPETKKPYVLLSKPSEIMYVDDPVGELSKILGLDPVCEVEEKPLVNFRPTPFPRNYKPPCIKRLLDPETKIEEGWRNESLIRVVSYFLQTSDEDDEEDLKIELKIKAMAWNLAHCKPPLDEREVDSVVKSVLKHGYYYKCRSLSVLCDLKSGCKVYDSFTKRVTQKLEEVMLRGEE